MKVIILNKKSLLKGTLIICLVIAVVIAVCQVVPQVAAALAPNRELPIYNVQRDDKEVSLTFDAAWGKILKGTFSLQHRG